MIVRGRGSKEREKGGGVEAEESPLLRPESARVSVPRVSRLCVPPLLYTAKDHFILIYCYSWLLPGAFVSSRSLHDLYLLALLCFLQQRACKWIGGIESDGRNKEQQPSWLVLCLRGTVVSCCHKLLLDLSHPMLSPSRRGRHGNWPDDKMRTRGRVLFVSRL